VPLTTDEKLLELSRETIAVFDKANSGVHAGFRPAHAKGILLNGTFMPSAEAGSLTRAPHLHRNSTPVTVRFSDFAGIPTVADKDPQGVRARAALRFAFTLASIFTPTSLVIRSTTSRRTPSRGLSSS
jgi:catalase